MRWPTISLTVLNLTFVSGHHGERREEPETTHPIGFITTDIEEEQP